MRTNYELWKLHEKVTRGVICNKVTPLEALAVYREIELRREIRNAVELRKAKTKLMDAIKV